MTYRKDIDGLRALAVLGVIIYHSEILIGNKFFLSGGFLGVDIFFVISGYLITSIIYQEITTKKNFSFVNFYERRIRRLLPALLIVLFFSLIFAYFLLLPIQFKAYLKSIISSIFFYSNFHFHYSGQAYGDAILSTKPLLHTWSLAVEEQFYILFPIVFLISCRILKNKIKYLFYFTIFISLLFATVINEQHASFNFYMILTRAWELMFGGLIALKHENNKKKTKDNFILSFLGIFLILFSFIFFDDPHKHPTFLTLIPIIGCCLIIYNDNSSNLVGKFLSYKIITNIGLISYSLYLWHHPILSFGKISGLTENNLFLKIILILISFFLSTLTYLFVEKRFRKKEIITEKKLGLILLPFISCFLIMIFLLPNNQEKKYPNIMKDLHNQTWFTTKQYNKPCFQRKSFFCNFNNNEKNQTVFLIGDSVMASIQEELKDNMKLRNLNFIPMTNAGCDFFEKAVKNDEFCNLQIQNNRIAKIKEYKNSTLIIHLNYKNIDKDKQEELIKLFYSNIKKYLELNHNIILIYPIPQWSINISDQLEKGYKKDKNIFLAEISKPENRIFIKYKSYQKDTKKIFEKFDELNHKNLYKLFPHQKFCNNSIKNRCIAHSLEQIFSIDGSHLSKEGSKILNNDLIKFIDEIYSL